MEISPSFSALNTSLKNLADVVKPNNATNINNKKAFEHPYSKEQGFTLKSLRYGYAEAEQTTSANQINNRQFIHAAVPNLALVSTMAAVADSSPDPKAKKPMIAFLKHFAQDFIKVIRPGDKLEIKAQLEKTYKNHRYIIAEIRRGSELVGKAIADFAFLPKEKMGLS